MSARVGLHAYHTPAASRQARLADKASRQQAYACTSHLAPSQLHVSRVARQRRLLTVCSLPGSEHLPSCSELKCAHAPAPTFATSTTRLVCRRCGWRQQVLGQAPARRSLERLHPAGAGGIHSPAGENRARRPGCSAAGPVRAFLGWRLSVKAAGRDQPAGPQAARWPRRGPGFAGSCWHGAAAARWVCQRPAASGRLLCCNVDVACACARAGHDGCCARRSALACCPAVGCCLIQMPTVALTRNLHSVGVHPLLCCRCAHPRPAPAPFHALAAWSADGARPAGSSKGSGCRPRHAAGHARRSSWRSRRRGRHGWCAGDDGCWQRCGSELYEACCSVCASSIERSATRAVSAACGVLRVAGCVLQQAQVASTLGCAGRA